MRRSAIHICGLPGWLILAVLAAATARPACAQEAEDNGPMVPRPEPTQPVTPHSVPVGPATDGGEPTSPGGNGDTSTTGPGDNANPATPGTRESTDDRLPSYWTRGESEVPLPIDRGESQWDESAGSYDIDTLNPLRYIDLLMDWSMTEINGALNSLIKSLDEPDANRIKLFGRFRLRWEDRNNYDNLVSNYDHVAFYRDGWLVGLQLNLDVLEFNASMHHVTGRRIDTLEDPYDVHQLNVTISGFEGDAIRFPVEFLDIWFRFVAYVGRGPLTFGRGRLIGSDDWELRGNNFDAVVLALADTAAGGGLSVFAMQKTKYVRGFNEIDGRRTVSGVSFIGIDPFGQLKSPDEQLPRLLLRPNEYDTAWFPVVNPRERRLAAGLDLYCLWAYEDATDTVGEVVPDAAGTATTGRVDQFTFGVRGALLFEEVLMLESEFALQLGSRGGNDVLAFMAHGEATVGIDWAVPMAISGMLDIISGDTNPHDGKQQGFDPMFASRHNRFSMLDWFAPRNLIHIGARISIQIASSTNIIWSVHLFRSFTTHDSVYGPTVDYIRLAADPAMNEAGDLGVVIGGAFEYHYTPRIHVLAGYAQLFPGKRLSSRGLGADAILFYVATDLRF